MAAIITIPGRLTKDPTLAQAGTSSVLRFSVATDVYDRKERKKVGAFYDVSLFGKRGESLEKILRKGSQVVVTGEHSSREYNGKTYQQCEAFSVELMGGSSKGWQPSSANEPAVDSTGDTQTAPTGTDGVSDDFPF